MTAGDYKAHINQGDSKTTAFDLTASFQEHLSLHQNVKPSWTLLQQRVMEEAAMTTGSPRRAKLQSVHNQQSINTQFFYRPGAFPAGLRERNIFHIKCQQEVGQSEKKNSPVTSR